jgi:uncharacterized protein (TIGR02722 family)
MGGKMTKKYRILWIVLSFTFAACASTPQVNRLSAGTVTDLSGYWNDTDVEIVCDSLIKSCLESPRVARITDDLGRLPVFVVGDFTNESDEHINTTILSNIMEIRIFNSGKADFVAGGDVRDTLRAERQDQQSNASEETAKGLANETGADFLLTGSVKTIVDRADGTATRTYYVTARLTNLETNTLLWTDQNSQIKKEIRNPKLRL